MATYDPTFYPGLHGAYGTVPEPIRIPPSPYEAARTAEPGLATAAPMAADVVQRELAGELSPETLNALQNAAAAYGIKTGMPGSQFVGQRGLTQLGLNVEQVRKQGLADYGTLLRETAALQTPQSLASEIAAHNKALAAAPDPRLAAEEMFKLWQRKFQYTKSQARPPEPFGGGVYSPPQAFRPGSSEPTDVLGFTTRRLESPGTYVGQSAGTGITYGGVPSYDMGVVPEVNMGVVPTVNMGVVPSSDYLGFMPGDVGYMEGA